MKIEIKDAKLSACEKYRYILTRGECRNPLVFIMLNPSTADHTEDDPTIRRCIGFARDNGFDGLVVLNLYALRSTNPDLLWSSDDAVGSDNDMYLLNAVLKYKRFVCAWGKNAKKERVKTVVDMLKRNGASLYCLGVNKDNSPKHPLYIAKDKQLTGWDL